MKVEGSCVYAIEVLVRPLKLDIPLGTLMSTSTTVTEVSHYIIYGVFEPPIKFGNITIRRFNFEVVAPKEVPPDVIKSEVSKALEKQLGNLSKSLKISILSTKLAETTTEMCTEAGERVVALTTKPAPEVAPTSTVKAGKNKEVAARTPTTTPTRTSTSKYMTATETSTTFPVRPEYAATTAYISRNLSIPLAIAAALIAGLIAYVLLIKPLK